MDWKPMIPHTRRTGALQTKSTNWSRLFGVSVLLSLVTQVGLLGLFYYNNKYSLHLHQTEINDIRRELDYLKNSVIQDLSEEMSPRNRREINRYQVSVDGDYQNDAESPTIVEAKYSESRKNGTYKGKDKTEGLRIYSSWFKNGRRATGRGRSSKMSPIKKHHRISAAWSESKTNSNLNAHFAGMIHRNSRSKSGPKTRGKKVPSGNESSRTKQRQLRRANKHNAESFSGMKSVHFESREPDKEDSGGEGHTVLNDDGHYRHWRLSHWSSRMRAGASFPMKNGTVRVSYPGVYYVYAQINYLDKSDINAFQILKNGQPLFLCTTMTTTTATSQRTSKANTCFTAGVVYLEQGDALSLRDLEPGRTAVLLPAHSFFGLIQISKLGI